MCRQVAKALGEFHYWELPWYRRIPMFIHIRLCVMCGKYHQQVVELQTGMREYLAHEGADDIPLDVHLSDAARNRIDAVVRGRDEQ